MILGAFLGHFTCTILACLAGSMVSRTISAPFSNVIVIVIDSKLFFIFSLFDCGNFIYNNFNYPSGNLLELILVFDNIGTSPPPGIINPFFW